MSREQQIATLQGELKRLEAAHDALEVTVKKWNEERRRLDAEIAKLRDEQLALRVKAWRMYQETGQQLELF